MHIPIVRHGRGRDTVFIGPSWAIRSLKTKLMTGQDASRS